MKQHVCSSNELNLLTRDQAASRLAISTRKLDLMREAGKLSFVQIGRRIGFLPCDLDRFIEAHRVESV